MNPAGPEGEMCVRSRSVSQAAGSAEREGERKYDGITKFECQKVTLA